MKLRKFLIQSIWRNGNAFSSPLMSIWIWLCMHKLLLLSLLLLFLFKFNEWTWAEQMSEHILYIKKKFASIEIVKCVRIRMWTYYNWIMTTDVTPHHADNASKNQVRSIVCSTDSIANFLEHFILSIYSTSLCCLFIYFFVWNETEKKRQFTIQCYTQI